MEKPSLVYNAYKKAHLFFYSKINSSIQLLVFKSNNDNHYSTFSTDVTGYDNAPTFSIARILTNTIPNIFTNETIDKIVKNEPLSQLEVKRDIEEIPNFKLWDMPTYMYWLAELSKNIIQYDNINEQVIYFYELPYIDLEKFNANLKSIDYYGTFEYISSSNYGKLNYSDETQNLFDYLPFNKMVTHIEESEKIMKEDNSDVYIVLACKKKGKDQIGFFHFPALFTGLYRKNNEKWLYLVASADPLPDETLLSRCKCLIIPGSELSVYEDFDFLRKTEVFLKQLIEDILFNGKYPQLKILGICFGMEIVISALKGKIANLGKGKAQRFPEKIKLNNDFWNLQFVKNSKVPQNELLKMCEAHGDYIDSFPDNYGLNIYGTSNSCKCEIMVDNKEKIFLIQGHPEYYPPFLVVRAADWYLSFLQREPTDENIKNYIVEFCEEEHNKNVNSKEWRQMCFTFMKKEC